MDNNNILTVLTSEDREEIRKSLKDIIIEQIKDDFRDCGTYMFDMDDINDMMQEAIEEIKEEIKPMLKDFMFNEMKNKLGID